MSDLSFQLILWSAIIALNATIMYMRGNITKLVPSASLVCEMSILILNADGCWILINNCSKSILFLVLAVVYLVVFVINLINIDIENNLGSSYVFSQFLFVLIFILELNLKYTNVGGNVEVVCRIG